LAELGEEHRAERNVDADAEGVGPADDLEQALLRELLDEQPVLRQQPGMVDADAMADPPAEILAEGAVEAKALELVLDRLLLVLGQKVDARQRLRVLGGRALREVDDVDRRPALLDQLLDGLVDRRLAVRELE